MSVSDLLGPIDWPAAAAVSVIAVAACIIITTSIAKRRSRRDLDQTFDLAKIDRDNAQALAAQRQRDVHETEIRKIEANVAIERDRSNAGLITSHARTSDAD